MNIYETDNHPAAGWGQQINDHLADIVGGAAGDYQVWWGGENPGYVRVATEQPGDLGAAMAAFGAVAVSTDKNTIDADGVDTAIITCDAGLTFDYQIKRDGVVMVSGTVNDGSLEFSTDTAGTYLITIFGDGDDIGFGQVEAV